MKYLILGSNSFAGASVVNYLLTQGHQVLGVSRSQEPHSTLLAYATNSNKGEFQFYPYDINQNFDDLKKLIEKEKPTVIVDFAGQGMVAESWENPAQWYQTNIVAKAKLHDYLRRCDFLERYVRVSTPEVYGSTDDFVTESQPFNPSTPYAISHAAIDMSLLAFYKQFQFPVILTRFANFYGPHQQLYRIIPRTIIYALTGKKLLLQGGGLSQRAFIYGGDVANGIDSVINHGKIGETYHFSAGNLISIVDLVKKIANMMNIDFERFVEIGPDRPGKDALYAMDVSKAKSELGWESQINLENGIMNTIRWVRDNIETINTLSLSYIHKA